MSRKKCCLKVVDFQVAFVIICLGGGMAEINKQVGLNIKKYRKKKGWTQEQLAFNSELHRAYIGQIERGEKNIGLKNLEKIAKSLGLSVETLVRNK